MRLLATILGAVWLTSCGLCERAEQTVVDLDASYDAQASGPDASGPTPPGDTQPKSTSEPSDGTRKNGQLGPVRSEKSGTSQSRSSRTAPEENASLAPLNLPKVEALTPETGLHRAAVVVDMHVDTLWQMHRRRLPYTARRLQANERRLQAGGVDAQFFSVWVPPDTRHPRRKALGLIDLFEAQVIQPGGPRVLALTAKDVAKGHTQGHPTALLGLEGTAALEGELAALDELYARGVRYVALTWNERNPFGVGAKAGGGGATPLGLELVRRLNEKRILLDVSHANRETFWNVISHSERPVIATHSNAWAVYAHPRNLDDLQLWAIAESGGVVGLNFHSRYLSPGRARWEDLIAHAEHMRRVGGDGILALGTDYDGDIVVPGGLPDMSRLDKLTTRAWKRGWSSPTIAGQLGHNVLRAMHETDVGVARRRVTHRPAPIREMNSTAVGSVPSQAVDRRATTAWATPENEGEGYALLLTGLGPDIDRIAICASTTTSISGVRRVAVRVKDQLGVERVRSELALSTEVRLHRLDLPNTASASHVYVDVEILEVKDGPPILAEVVLEKIVRPVPSAIARP